MTGGGRGASPRERVVVVGAVLLAVAAAVVGVLVGAAHSARGAHHHSHGALFVAVFAAVAGVLVGAMMTWRIRRNNRLPVMRRVRRWDFSQRRATARAVQKGQPVTGEQRELAQAQFDLLTSMTRRLWVVLPIGIVVFVVNAAANVGGLRPLWTALAALEIVCSAALLILRRVQLRRYQRALFQPVHED
jgi:hypothetical protein